MLMNKRSLMRSGPNAKRRDRRKWLTADKEADKAAVKAVRVRVSEDPVRADPAADAFAKECKVAVRTKVLIAHRAFQVEEEVVPATFLKGFRMVLAQVQLQPIHNLVLS
jgi:hypothetical protein